ncbi:metal-dependent hydrolase [Priestia flexa]|uniref:metal-dependent hydrolase n=1 Tax=Priestia TaxID=2800373 RepID=UPI001C99D94E|nr:metal-dependent hydrolase [Priestia flexa]MBY6023612.1 metal-dependent hydrolase [Nitratireductor sp. DP7N14-4]MDT2048296.1 metal-dependent hydrolase [Priestia flexa]
MDTGTHIAMGIAIGALATLDPVVASSSVTTEAVMIGVIAGSLAPDLDTILKLKNNAHYIRNHRGITHSIPAVALWPLLIIVIVSLFFPNANLFHLWIWTFAAVIIHVFVDVFNAYGTQALRPFTDKWIALGVINTFDYFIFFVHVVAILIWFLGMSPGPTFITMYSIIALYYVWRFYMRHQIAKKIRQKFPDVVKMNISPTIRFTHWHLAITTKESFHVGRAVGPKIFIYDTFKKVPIPESDVIDVAKRDENLAAFLSFSPIYRWEVDEYSDHIEVRFIDLRYRSKDYYPFVAVVQLDYDLNIICSYTGWIFSEKKLRKKLDYLPH